MAHLGTEATVTMRVIELVLIGFYTLELGLKLMVHGVFLLFLVEWRWNIFDIFLVLFSLSDVMITLCSSEKAPTSPSCASSASSS